MSYSFQLVIMRVLRAKSHEKYCDCLISNLRGLFFCLSHANYRNSQTFSDSNVPIDLMMREEFQKLIRLESRQVYLKMTFPYFRIYSLHFYKCSLNLIFRKLQTKKKKFNVWKSFSSRLHVEFCKSVFRILFLSHH